MRHKYSIAGQVQGVGFRPFVFRTAQENTLTGTVCNGAEGVIIEVQGTLAQLESFRQSLTTQTPPLAQVTSLEQQTIPTKENEQEFSIKKSTAGEKSSVLISPDVATCEDCLTDIRAGQNFRYEYPFTNCTNCGPRYTITRSIPYDRGSTSMGCFPLCPRCREEYENPLDRRFHAQPNACPHCGPHVWLATKEKEELARGEEALATLVNELKKGAIAAVKGLGGFHLVCDACQEKSVLRLRKQKHRPHKPLALMVPDMAVARKIAIISEHEEAVLSSKERPIVLVAKKNGHALDLAPSLAPDTDYIGLMLPYTPLHHILLKKYSAVVKTPALVMTSGNMSAEPICLGNREARARLENLADIFLFHNRDILIRCDDSVVRVNPYTEKMLPLRRARGFTPAPIFLPYNGKTVLGIGPELKCTLTLTKGDQAFPSQHLGDMENLATQAFHEEILEHLETILQIKPELIVHDVHPNYATTRLAKELGKKRNIPVQSLQHHYAHIHAVLAENRHQGPAIGLALDGTGYGDDGTIWGGECLYVDNESLEHQRLGRFSHIPLPGGEMAVREPWRIAQGMLHTLGIDALATGDWPWMQEFSAQAALLPQILEKGINTPKTSSCGRLFDGMAALLGLGNTISYEGQAAIRLEQLQDKTENGAYECPVLTDEDPATLDTLSLIAAAIHDIQQGEAPGRIARRFHLGLVNGLAEMAAAFCGILGVEHVALSGGAMQNLTLASQLPLALEMYGIQTLGHTLIPPNDACISLGQAMWGQRILALDDITS